MTAGTQQVWTLELIPISGFLTTQKLLVLLWTEFFSSLELRTVMMCFTPRHGVTTITLRKLTPMCASEQHIPTAPTGTTCSLRVCSMCRWEPYLKAASPLSTPSATRIPSNSLLAMFHSQCKPSPLSDLPRTEESSMDPISLMALSGNLATLTYAMEWSKAPPTSTFQQLSSPTLWVAGAQETALQSLLSAPQTLESALAHHSYSVLSYWLESRFWPYSQYFDNSD